MTHRLIQFCEYAIYGMLLACAAFAFVDTARGDVGRWGYPEGTVQHEGNWCFAFDGQKRHPRWVLEHITPESLQGNAPRPDTFVEDERVPVEFRSRLTDYLGSGWDRGHLAAAGNYGTLEAKQRTFLLSNIAPQHPQLNRGPWKQLEEATREMAAGSQQIWVCTMLPYLRSGSHVSHRLAGDVSVPTHWGKTVLRIDRDNRLHLHAWLAPNIANAGEPKDWRVSVDTLERSAGLDFWSGLPDDLEARLEANP